ncbi:MAG: hypothetical protein IKA47_07510, partial [Oscillospiraceae bacterium]|nr:hypothetical protein [Oscillospiraceae bacterium]
MLGQLDNVVLANGTPPRNKANNPAGLDYVLATREGTGDISSLFVSVVEPYIGTNYITSSEFVKVTSAKGEVTDNTVKAVKLTFVNGRTDYVVYSEDETTEYTIDGKFSFKGFFGVYSERDGEVV